MAVDFVDASLFHHRFLCRYLGAEGRSSLTSVFASQLVQQLVAMFVALRFAARAAGTPDPRLAVVDLCELTSVASPAPAPSPFSILQSGLVHSASSVASRIAQQCVLTNHCPGPSVQAPCGMRAPPPSLAFVLLFGLFLEGCGVVVTDCVRV